MERVLLILELFCLYGLVKYAVTKTNALKLRPSPQLAFPILILLFFLICGISFYWIKERQRDFLRNADDAITRQQSMLEYNIKKQK
jgi:hypothetical protein